MSDRVPPRGPAGPTAQDDLAQYRRNADAHLAKVGSKGLVGRLDKYLEESKADWAGVTAVQSADEAFLVGRALLEFAHPYTSQRWMRRRVEEIQVVDERTIERVVSFHVDLGSFATEELPHIGGTFLIPLARLDRSAHAVTRVISERGVELTQPTVGVERQLIAQGVLSQLGASTKASPELEALAVDAISISWRPVPKLARAAQRRHARDVIAQACFVAEKEGFNSDEVRDLARALTQWQRRYLLLAEVPRNAVVDGKTILVLTYKESIPTPQVIDRHGVHLQLAIAMLRKAFFGSLSWPLRIPVRGVGDAESSHVLLTAPPGFRAVDAGLRMEFSGEDAGNTWVRDDDRLPAAAHLFVATRRRLLREAELVVSFYAYKTGFFLESLLSSVALWVLLQTLYHRLAHVRFRTDVILNQGDTALTAAALMLLPVLMVLVLLQRDHHRLASKSFAFARLLLAMDAIAGFIAAVDLGVPGTQQTNHDIWYACTITAGVIAARLCIGGILHIWRSSRFRAAIIGLIWYWREERAGLQERTVLSRLLLRQTDSWRTFPQVDTVEEVWVEELDDLVELDQYRHDTGWKSPGLGEAVRTSA